MIAGETLRNLRLIYFSPADTKEAGFIETDHFGRRFTGGAHSHFDLSAVPQRWLRDLLWDHMADLLRSPRCPRTRGAFDALRRASIELGIFLQADAPGGGQDPALLSAEHMHRFVADQRHRERHNLPSAAIVRSDCKPSGVTTATRRAVFLYARVLLRRALDCGDTARLGLDTGFIAAMPEAGPDPRRSRNPLTDQAARALADEANLCNLAEVHDPNDRGVRDVWEALVFTGRRCSEVLQLRLLTSADKPLSRAEAQALAIDLSRRSTPAEGGFCTFQPVVNGAGCPFGLDCEHCDKFVLSGADLLYWRRKAEQWRSIAERAPDDATADYLHQVFTPTARAIEGLENALAGLGLLDEALAMDYRRPQDYFNRVWSIAFRTADLASPEPRTEPGPPLWACPPGREPPRPSQHAGKPRNCPSAVSRML
jgi:hypothetical protein